MHVCVCVYACACACVVYDYTHTHTHTHTHTAKSKDAFLKDKGLRTMLMTVSYNACTLRQNQKLKAKQ